MAHRIKFEALSKPVGALWLLNGYIGAICFVKRILRRL